MISTLSLHILAAWVLAANPTQRMQKSYTETALFVILKSKVNKFSFQNVIPSQSNLPTITTHKSLVYQY